MDLNEYKGRLTLELSTQPQKQAKALAAVDSLSAGIAELASLGYRVAAVDEFTTHEPPRPEEFPKMLYCAGKVPPEVTVEDEAGEAEARKNDYRGLNEALAPLQPAVDSNPLTPNLAPPAHAPDPPITDKEVLEQRIAEGSGASVDTVHEDPPEH